MGNPNDNSTEPNNGDAAPESLDFIREIIANDLSSGKHASTVTRFPPEPNGYIHIGHAKSICLNFGVAQESDASVCHLRFDDTNPVKEDIEYVDSIKEDVAWLGFDWGKNLYFASDYFEKLYGYAVELIENGKAFVCDLTLDEIAEHRGTPTRPGKNSPYRDRSPEENLELFERMRVGEFEDGTRVLRAKIDMASPNLHMRDPVLYRIRKTQHHRTGDKWCIYPMYDFTHCLSDSIEGITHSLCTLEFEVHRPLYDWVLDNVEVDCHPRVAINLNIIQHPVVKRPVHLKLQCAQRVGDALNRVRQAVREIVHRVDTPLVTGAVMLRFADAIQHRIAHVQVRRGHIDLRPQHPRAVLEFADPHTLEQLEIFLRRPIAVRTVFAGASRGAAMLGDLVQR